MDKAINITCEWIPSEETKMNNSDAPEMKCGRYHQSNFPGVSGYGLNRWVICGYLKVDYQSLLSSGVTENEIIEDCLVFLNKPPPHKRKPLYGSLKPVVAPWRKGKTANYDVVQRPGYLIVCFETDQRKNKNFWGSGPKDAA